MALPIWENHNMLTELVRSRSWRERLFTRPWRPLVDRKVQLVPSRAVYRMLVPPHFKAFHAGFNEGRFVLMCHPDMAERIRQVVAVDARRYPGIVEAATAGTVLLDYGDES